MLCPRFAVIRERPAGGDHLAARGACAAGGQDLRGRRLAGAAGGGAPDAPGHAGRPGRGTEPGAHLRRERERPAGFEPVAETLEDAYFLLDALRSRTPSRRRHERAPPAGRGARRVALTLRRPMVWTLLVAPPPAVLGDVHGVRAGPLARGHVDRREQGVPHLGVLESRQIMTIVTFLFYTFFIAVAAGMAYPRRRVAGPEVLHATPLQPAEYVVGEVRRRRGGLPRGARRQPPGAASSSTIVAPRTRA